MAIEAASGWPTPRRGDPPGPARPRAEAPRRAPVWTRIGLGFGALVARVVPLRVLVALWRGWGPLLYVALPGTRRALLDNAAHVLGADSTHAERRRMAIGVLKSFAQFTAELLASKRRLPVDDELFETMVGREHFERARAVGRGIIAVTLHIGNYESGPMLLARLHQPLAILLRGDPVASFDRRRARRHERHGIREIRMDRSAFFGVEALAVLRAGGVVLLAGDVGFEEGRGERFPFFDAPAPFTTWPAELALKSGASILPSFVVRDDTGRYRLEIHEPIPAAGGDPADLTRRLVATFEDVVRRHPDQWLIIHRYWT